MESLYIPPKENSNIINFDSKLFIHNPVNYWETLRRRLENKKYFNMKKQIKYNDLLILLFSLSIFVVISIIIFGVYKIVG